MNDLIIIIVQIHHQLSNDMVTHHLMTFMVRKPRTCFNKTDRFDILRTIWLEAVN